MKQIELSKWLKFVIAFAAFIAAILCLLIVPALGKEAVLMNPELDYMFWPCLVFIWVTAIPFYIALYKAWLICQEISKDNSFCIENSKSLKLISKLALLECILYLAAMFILLILNLLHPSIILGVLFIIFVGISIAIASATISHLVENASELKKENDLTI
ncbi:Protein of unknown function [Clostridium amylolyticum]|uniref:DUF2975 domain-containing protein n=1 Tax=Clostridium amylolyticum TaxID=1121298 RepID=A0A1M6MDG7_9CLOT|nr:DUF2975 domain-containing protein [Clostridium amylolyticum]SHJ81495.1 Protein of unknown function [Clostridium amylolyticum]